MIIKETAQQRLERKRKYARDKQREWRKNNKQWYSKHKVKYNANSKKWRQQQKEKANNPTIQYSEELSYKSKMISSAKSRATKSGYEFNLNINDFEIPTTCPILGIELKLNNGYSQRDYSPSIDRIDSTKGYTKENIIIVSFKANRLKSNATLSELILLGKWAGNYVSSNYVP